jgi:hypothetical protein
LNDRSLERYALLLLWSTLRNTLQPELASALAKDRAKRSDAALLRLVAGYGQLPKLRAAFSEQYAALLAEARRLARRGGVPELAANFASLDDNPVFVGIPEVAETLEGLLVALAKEGKAADASFDSLLTQVVGAEAAMRDAYESAVATLEPVGMGSVQAVTAAALERYLQAHPRGSPEVRVKSVIDIPGGRSKRTILVELERPAQLPPALVLRMDTGRGVGTKVGDEFSLLDRVALASERVRDPLPGPS